ncbi:MAG: hypothetical protein RDU20_04150 [Desulfomonilaceae bacterium]|nr:hypothetical protein [Desulfomonilaceae bacterium]
MAFEPGKLMRKLYGLVILLVVLQAVAIGLVIRFASDRMERDRTLLERTGVMMEEVFPGIRKDLSDISKKAIEIKSGISGLERQVSQVDRHVGRVGQEVVHVGTQVKDVNGNLTGFVHDRSGLIWGHSLNPYLLLGVLVAMVASFPVCAWFFGRRREAPAAPHRDALLDSPAESFLIRLTRLSELVGKIGADTRKSGRPSPELESLMMETERLIREARSELDVLVPNTSADPGDDDIRPDKLNERNPLLH